jgi:hypothetical protein
LNTALPILICESKVLVILMVLPEAEAIATRSAMHTIFIIVAKQSR